ncbi:MAG: hypothetical protein WAQ05_16650 [Rubrivivax sp.]
MNVKHILAAAVFAVAGTAAMADDITIVNDNFVARKCRAEVRNTPRAQGMAFNPAA